MTRLMSTALGNKQTDSHTCFPQWLAQCVLAWNLAEPSGQILSSTLLKSPLPVFRTTSTLLSRQPWSGRTSKLLADSPINYTPRTYSIYIWSFIYKCLLYAAFSRTTFLYLNTRVKGNLEVQLNQLRSQVWNLAHRSCRAPAENPLSQSQYSKSSQVPLRCDTIRKREDNEEIKKEAERLAAAKKGMDYQNWIFSLLPTGFDKTWVKHGGSSP